MMEKWASKLKWPKIGEKENHENEFSNLQEAQILSQIESNYSNENLLKAILLTLAYEQTDAQNETNGTFNPYLGNLSVELLANAANREFRIMSRQISEICKSLLHQECNGKNDLYLAALEKITDKVESKLEILDNAEKPF